MFENWILIIFNVLRWVPKSHNSVSNAGKRGFFALSFFPVFLLFILFLSSLLIYKYNISLYLETNADQLLQNSQHILQGFMRGKLDVVILVRIFLGIIMDRHVKLPFQRSHQMAERNILVNQVAATLHLIKQSIDRPDRYRMRRMRINQTFVRLQDSRLVFACPYIHFDTPLFPGSCSCKNQLDRKLL